MSRKKKQTWVIRYLRLDDSGRRMPSDFVCAVEARTDGEARQMAHEEFRRFVLERRLSVLFLTGEKL